MFLRSKKCKSGVTDWMEFPSSSKSGVQVGEELAGHSEKFYPSAGESLFAVGCRDDRPMVDSGSVVSTCPMDSATSVPTEKVHYCMNLESVLGESLRLYGIKRNVPFTNRTGSTRNVNVEVTDTNRAILSVQIMSEQNAGAWNMLKCLIRYIVGHGRLVQVISEQRHVTAPRVDTDSDYAGCVLTR